MRFKHINGKLIDKDQVFAMPVWNWWVLIDVTRYCIYACYVNHTLIMCNWSQFVITMMGFNQYNDVSYQKNPPVRQLYIQVKNRLRCCLIFSQSSNQLYVFTGLLKIWKAEPSGLWLKHWVIHIPMRDFIAIIWEMGSEAVK